MARLGTQVEIEMEQALKQLYVRTQASKDKAYRSHQLVCQQVRTQVINFSAYAQANSEQKTTIVVSAVAKLQHK